MKHKTIDLEDLGTKESREAELLKELEEKQKVIDRLQNEL